MRGLTIYLWTVGLGLAGLIAVFWVSGGPPNSTARRPLDVTMAYSCGYLDGISHAPIVPPKHLDWCGEYTKIAHENGFNP